MKKQTAVEELHAKSAELIQAFLDKKISERDLITMHHNSFYPAKDSEEKQITEAWTSGNFNTDNDGKPLDGYCISGVQYYRKTFK
jgi:hypothetical protein